MSRRAKAGQPTGSNCDGLPSCSIGFEPIRTYPGMDTYIHCMASVKFLSGMSTVKVGHVAKK